MRSLRFRLFVLWVLSLVASIAVGAVLVQFFHESTTAQVQRAEAVVARACDMIRDRYAFYTANWSGSAATSDMAQFRSGLAAVVSAALAHELGVEGGVWQAGAGSLAYAFPTYEGTGRKTDLPAAESDRIREVNQQAAREEQAILSQSVARTQTLLVFACPLDGPLPGLTGWTMTRVEAAPGYDRLRLGLGVLFLLLIAQSAWLTLLTASWSRRLGRIEKALGHTGADRMPQLAFTGDPELDRVVAALNDAGQRVDEAHRRSDELAARVATAERLAALGRLAAGLAHEIRNPMTAMRLKAENALAAGDARWEPALRSILGQIARIDGLVAELLAMAHRREASPRKVDVPHFLAGCAADCHELASARGVALAIGNSVACAEFDPDLIQRAVTNLLLNAIQHTPSGGQVTVSALEQGEVLRILVANPGPGVVPDVQKNLFEPFVTGRADGTGLGLAIVRELVEAHGGQAQLIRAGGVGQDTIFAVDLPWRAC